MCCTVVYGIGTQTRNQILSDLLGREHFNYLPLVPLFKYIQRLAHSLEGKSNFNAQVYMRSAVNQFIKNRRLLSYANLLWLHHLQIIC